MLIGLDAFAKLNARARGVAQGKLEAFQNVSNSDFTHLKRRSAKRGASSYSLEQRKVFPLQKSAFYFFRH